MISKEENELFAARSMARAANVKKYMKLRNVSIRVMSNDLFNGVRDTVIHLRSGKGQGGKHYEPTITTITKVAKYLDCEIADLLADVKSI